MSATAREEKPRQNRPPQPFDANHPLDQFLNGRFPEGGRFRTAQKDRVQSSTEDLQAFVQFLKSEGIRSIHTPVSGSQISTERNQKSRFCTRTL
jgi:hypothetical protein